MAAASGDLSAQDMLIRSYQRRIAGFVIAQTGRQDAVEDLCQIILLKMLAQLPRLKAYGKFDQWLFRIARNACLDFFRREKWRRFLMPWESSHQEVAEAPPSARREINGLWEALQKLPASQRELLVLLQEGEWSYDDLARMTGSTVSAVKSKLKPGRMFGGAFSSGLNPNRNPSSA